MNGYPASIFTTVMQMLRRNAELKVYVLHDATSQGVSLIHTLSTSSEWFGSQTVQYFELGLLPRQVIGKRRIERLQSAVFTQDATQLPEVVRKTLTAAELQWLDRGYSVELESFSPRRIVRAVNQGIAKSLDPDQSDSLVAFEEDEFVYYSDSFG